MSSSCFTSIFSFSSLCRPRLPSSSTSFASALVCLPRSSSIEAQLRMVRLRTSIPASRSKPSTGGYGLTSWLVVPSASASSHDRRATATIDNGNNGVGLVPASLFVGGGSSPRRGGGATARASWERTCVLMLLVVAWGWIMTTIGLVLYHGFYKIEHHHHENGQEEGAAAATANVVKPASPPGHLHPFESPLLIFTCQRDNYLRQTLDDILRYVPDSCLMGCPIVISQDGTNAAVTDVIKEYQHKFQQQKSIDVVHWQHPTAKLRGSMNAYQALAVHYGWALNRLFDESSPFLASESLRDVDAATVVPQRVVILEEDLHVAPDFFAYMAATAPWLDTDPTLLAISAFNDNGLNHHVQNATRVVRSDFFPGLGWMMTQKLWTSELQSKWPKGYWDDWLREPDQRRGRHILRPEVSRTFHFGTQGGASSNQFGGQLSSILLNPNPVDWTQVDLSYLRADRFDRAYWNMIHSSRHADSLDEALKAVITSDVQVDYHSLQDFQSMAEQLGIMTDEKAGILRTSYKGIVEYRPVENGNILFLSPPMQELQKEFDLVQ